MAKRKIDWNGLISSFEEREKKKKEEELSSFFNDSGAFLDTATNAYNAANFDTTRRSYDQFLNDSSSWRERSSGARSYLDTIRGGMDEESYRSLVDYLDVFDKALTDITSGYENKTDYYSKFDNERSARLYSMSLEELKKERETVAGSDYGKPSDEATNWFEKFLTSFVDDASQKKTDLDEIDKYIEIRQQEENTRRSKEKADQMTADALNSWRFAELSSYVPSSKENGRFYDMVNGAAPEVYTAPKNNAPLGALTQYNMTNTESVTRYEFERKKAAEMTDDEKKAYTYWYNAEQKGIVPEGTAESYLEAIEIDKRATETRKEDLSKKAAEDPLGYGLANIVLSPYKLPTLVQDVMAPLSGNDINVYDYEHSFPQASAAIQKGATENMSDVGAFFYNTGMSMLNTGYNLALGGGGVATTLLMGGGAAADTIVAAKERGASDGQAVLSGILAGAAEAVFEKFSIDQFMKPSGRAGVFNAIKDVLKQSLTEASEETLTEITNMVADLIINKDLSEHETAIRQYMSQGMSYQEAVKKVSGESALQIVEAAAGGFVSGAGFGGVAATRNALDNRAVGKSILEGNLAGELEAYAAGSSDKDVQKRLAEYQKKAQKKGSPNASYAGALYRTSANAAYSTYGEEAQKATKDFVAKEMESAGIAADDEITDIITYYAYGAKNAALSDESIRKLDSAGALQFAEDLKADDTRRLKAFENEAFKAAEKGVETVENIAERSLKLDEIKKAFDVSADGASVENVVVNNKGEILVSQGTDLISPEKAKVDLETAEAIYFAEELPVDARSSFFSGYRDNVVNGTVSSEDYTNAFDYAISAGINSLGVDRVMQNTDGILPRETALKIYEKGLDLKNQSKREIESGKEAVSAINKRLGIKSVTPGKVDDSAVRYYEMGENDRRRSVIGVARVIAASTGRNIVLFDSTKVERARGKENGYYDPKTNTIYIDVNAGVNETAGVFQDCMLPTLSHELVHQFAKEDVDGYNALRDLVMDSLAENRLKGETVDNREEVIKKLRDEIVREEIENIRKSDPKRFEDKSEKTVYAIAEEELVARACEDRLTNSRLMKTFIDEMDAKDSRLARAFSNMLSTAVRHLKSQFQRLVDSYKAGSREADIIAKGIDKLDAIQAQFDALLERRNPANEAEIESTQDVPVQIDLSSESAAPMKQDRSGFNQYSSFEDQIKYIVSPEHKGEEIRQPLIVGRTPQLWRDIGFSDLPITMSVSHTRENYFPKSEEYPNGKGMGKKLYQLPEQIKNPIAIFASETHPEDSVVVLIELKDKNGNSVVTPVEVNGISKNAGYQIDVNRIKTAFGKENALALLRNAVNAETMGENALFYWQKNKAMSMALSGGVQFPTTVPILDGFIHSIYENPKLVNTNILLQTDTKQFKRWFGKSKAVKKDGTPRILYHYTDAEFSEFDTSKSGSNQGKTHGDGIYLSSSPDEFSYAGKNRYEFYASVKRPFEMELTRNQAEKIYEKYAAPFHEDRFNTYRPHAIDALMSRYKVFDYLDEYATQNNVKVSDILKELGYDGVHDGTEWVVFDKTQVKSATDNIGTFDKNEGNFYYQSRTPYQSARDILVSYAEDAKNTKVREEYVGEYVERVKRLDRKQIRLYEAESNLALAMDQNDQSAIDVYTKRAENIQGEINTLSEGLQKMEESREMRAIVRREKEATLRRAKKEAKMDLRWEQAYGRKAVAEAKEEGRERLRQYREDLERGSRIKRIQARTRLLAERILANNKDSHIPDAVKKSVSDFITAIDFSSKRYLEEGVPTLTDLKFEKLLKDVKESIEKNRLGFGEEKYAAKSKKEKAKTSEAKEEGEEGNGIDIADEILVAMDELNEQIASFLAEQDSFVLNELPTEVLKDLDLVLAGITRSLNNIDKRFAGARSEEISELAEDSIVTMQEMKPAKNPTFKNLNKLLKFDMLTPSTFFKLFGKGGENIYNSLLKGWGQYARLANEIKIFADKAWDKEEVKAWAHTIKEVELNGQKFKATEAQLMHLYLVNKREQGNRHLDGQGFNVEEHGKGKKGFTRSALIKSTKEQRDAFFEKNLTDRQREVADKIQKFFVEVCAAWGNEVGMIRWGIRPFNDENYVPLYSDKNQLASRAPEATNFNLYRLLNPGFGKALNPDAKNGLLIYDIFDVFAEHAVDMAKYRTLALPILDSVRWLNYREPAFDEYGNPIRGDVTLKTVTENAYGKAAIDYLTNFLSDMNGATRAENSSLQSLASKLAGSYKKAAVAFNLKVAALQPTSYMRASKILSEKSLAQAFALNKEKLGVEKTEKYAALAEKYSGMALWKSLGFFDINISNGLASIIKHDETWMDKATEAGMFLAANADRLTLGTLFKACQIEIINSGKAKGLTQEQIFQKAGELLDQVIVETQVVDSTITRSGAMRKRGFFERTVTSFMSEPTVSYNMVVDAGTRMINEMRKGASAMDAFRKHGRLIRKTAVSYISTAAAATIVEAIFAALRRDKDEELLDAFSKEIPSKAYENLSIAGKIPLVKDIIAAIRSIFGEYYSSDKMEYAAINLAANLIKKGQKIIKEGDYSSETVYAFAKEAGKLFSYASGFAASNLWREVETIWNNTVGLALPDKMLGSGSVSNADRLRLAEKNGTIKKTVGDLIEDKKAEVIEEYPRMDAEEAEKKAKTAVRSSVTNYFKELFLAAYDDGNGTEIARIERMLESTGLYEDVEETLTNWKEAYEEELFLKGK